MPTAAKSQNTLDELLGRIAALDSEKAKAVREILEANSGFTANPDVIGQFSDVTGWGSSFGRQGMALLEDLYHFVNDTSKGDLPSSRLMLLLDEVGQDDAPAYRQTAIINLEHILAPILALDRVEHIQRLERGFLPSIKSINSFVDVRPRFSSTRKEIEEAVLLVQLQIIAEHDGDTSRFVCQLTERDLTKLQEALDLARQKLGVAARQINFHRKKEEPK